MSVTPAAAAAMAPRDHLGTFEGRDVLRTTVAITKAGDGLSAALGIEPDALPMGRTVYVLLECTVGGVTFEPAEKSDPEMGHVRKHKLVAGTATIVDTDVARPLIAEQRRRIDEARGVQALPLDEDSEDAFAELDDDEPIAGEVQDLASRRRGRGRKPAAES